MEKKERVEEAKVKKQELPSFNPESISELVAQIKKDPNCKRPGCYGRGYVGVDYKTNTLILCKCASFEENNYTKMIKMENAIERTVFLILEKQTIELKRLDEIQKTLDAMEKIPIIGKMVKKRKVVDETGKVENLKENKS